MEFGNLDFNSSGPLGLQLREILEKKILSLELKVGEKLPPQEELRKIYHVSNDTIETALSSLMKEGYITRRPRRGTIVISSSPSKTVDLTKKNIVCLVICTGKVKDTIGNSYFSNLINGIESEAKETRLHLVYQTLCEGEPLDFKDKENEVAGLVVAGNITPRHIKAVKKTTKPFVLVGEILQETQTSENADIISSDDFQNTYQATKHLLSLGHKKIVYLAPYLNRFPWETEHFRGYRQALKEAGIMCDNNMLVETGTGQDIDKAYRAMKKFMQKNIAFTAVVIAEDSNYYFGLIKLFGQKNIRVPEDVSIVVQDALPGVTSSSADNAGIGRACVKRLVYRLTDPAWKPEKVAVPGELQVRESTKKIK